MTSTRAQPASPNAVLFGGKRAKVETDEGRAAAVIAKHQKLAENSAVIAAQPRRGAANQVPASKSKVTENQIQSRDIASYLVRMG